MQLPGPPALHLMKHSFSTLPIAQHWHCKPTLPTGPHRNCRSLCNWSACSSGWLHSWCSSTGPWRGRCCCHHCCCYLQKRRRKWCCHCCRHCCCCWPGKGCYCNSYLLWRAHVPGARAAGVPLCTDRDRRDPDEGGALRPRRTKGRAFPAK